MFHGNAVTSATTATSPYTVSLDGTNDNVLSLNGGTAVDGNIITLSIVTSTGLIESVNITLVG
jgi:hypothetical protein